jgi:gas vesicle structural protein
MAVSTQGSGPSGGALTDVLELILDRGVVIDIFVRVSLIGIELLTIEARIVVASVDTYLRYAEAVGRLNLDSGRKVGAQDLIGGGGRPERAIEAAKDQLGEMFGTFAQPAEQPSPAPHGDGRRPGPSR